MFGRDGISQVRLRRYSDDRQDRQGQGPSQSIQTPRPSGMGYLTPRWRNSPPSKCTVNVSKQIRLMGYSSRMDLAQILLVSPQKARRPH